MPSTLEKTRKRIAKKRGTLGSLHEGSRDSRRLRKALIRDERLEKIASIRRKQEQPWIDRVKYFQEAVRERESKVFAAEEFEAAVKAFVHQYDEEMASLKQTRRTGRPPSMREDSLKMKIAVLGKELQNGFLTPDLTNEGCIELLGQWEGSWSQLSSLRWVRISTDGSARPAVFPPNKD